MEKPDCHLISFSMKNRRWLIPSLILGTLLLDSVVLPLIIISYPKSLVDVGYLEINWKASCPAEIGNLLFAFANGQIILLALWGGIARWFAPWRWLLVGLVSFSWAAFFFHLGYPFSSTKNSSTSFLLLGSVLLLSLWCLRIGGLKWGNIQPETTIKESIDYERYQFPLRLILEMNNDRCCLL